MSATVTTQAELDAALASGEARIIIDSPRDVWLSLIASGSATVEAYGSATVRASGSATVRAYGSATVRASGSATVRAYDSATVRAYGSATVRAYDSATVEAYGSATVEASGSATVEAYDSATVEASGSATVRASGSATVRASGSATVRAYGSATVRAYDSATVEASGSATVRAYGSATVRASSHVATHLHSQSVTVTGGVVIDVSALDLTDPTTWADYSGVDHTDRHATVFKAVDDTLNAGQGYTITAYPIGSTVAAPDWKPTADCGHGLHFGATSHHANRYYRGGGPARYLECRVALDTLVPLGDKCKAPSCEVVREVDVMGRPLGFEQLTA